MSNSPKKPRGISRLIAALKRRPAALWQRQAAKPQTRSNSPPRNVLVGFLDALGVSLGNPILFDAAGESGRGSWRPVFDELVARVEAGEFGAVITSAFDRLGRDKGDLQRLYVAAAATATLIVIGDRIYDLSDVDDRRFMDLQDLLARWAHEQRVQRRLTGRTALRKKSYLFLLPTSIGATHE